MVYITAIHMAYGGTRHEHIEAVRWKDPSDGNIQTSTVARMVQWIDKEGGVAKVSDGQTTVDVGVVHASPPYLRTYADRTPTDNLLYLPRY